MKDRRLISYLAFDERLEAEMKAAQRECEDITRYFQEPRHVEEICGTLEDDENDKNPRRHGKERMKTVSVAIIMCLHIGIDPPDAPPRTDPGARKLAWIDPSHCNPHKAAVEVAHALQKSYERWQPRAKYRIACDPPLDDVRKIATNLRRVSSNDRILFHYNGHGVPKPTENGEIWVFNKSFTQYIPLSIYDLQSWIEFPAIYVWECHSAENIIKSFLIFADDHQANWQSRFDIWQEEEAVLPAISSKMDQAEQAEAMGFMEKFPKFRDCIHLASCKTGQYLPFSDPNLPADLFTSCLTTPIQTAILWYLIKTNRRNEFPENVLEMIPGNLNERRTVLGELNWIFTAITDTIAFTSIDRDVFQRLFRQDLLLASLFRSFLLAQRIMNAYDVLPVSWPALKNTAHHELWASWDSTLDLTLDYVKEQIFAAKTKQVIMSGRQIMPHSTVYPFLTLVDFDAYINVNDSNSNWFFVEQLQAFELWLDFGMDRGKPPLQLPVVLQVLLSQAHRVRALRLLARFVDFGRWAVGYSLSVGIFPYILRLLQSNTRELRQSLAFIWAKILAVDPTCQIELFKENGEEGAPTPSPQQNGRAGMPGDMSQSNLYANGSTSHIDRLQQPQIGGRFQTNQNQIQELHQQYTRQMQQQQHLQQGGRSSLQTPGPSVAKKREIPLRYTYFLSILNDPDTKPNEKIVPAFIMAMLTHNNYRKAQESLTEKDYVNLCTNMLCDPDVDCRLLKLWLLIGLGRLWSDFDKSRWQAFRLSAYDPVCEQLDHPSPEVRAAAVFALGSLLKNSSQSDDHASAIEESLADELCNHCTFDGSVLVREELIVALQWFVFDFERRFVKLLLDLVRPCKITIPQQSETGEHEEDVAVDIASKMTTKKKKDEPIEYDAPIRKKMSTSVFQIAVEEDVLNDVDGKIHTIGYDVGKVERQPEDVEYRARAIAQIRHLEAKTFNEAVARTWLSLLRLSLDPVENVARMAQKIVKRVEAGTHVMEAAMHSKISSLNQQQMVRKVSRTTVQPPSLRAIGSGKRLMPQIIQDQLKKEKEDAENAKNESRVKFLVGSPAQDAPIPTTMTMTTTAPTIPTVVHTPTTSSASTTRSGEIQKNIVLIPGDGVSSQSSQRSENEFVSTDFVEAMVRSFTPKRKNVVGNFKVSQQDSKTLRNVIDNPIVNTQFVAWCSRIFVEPIMHILEENSNENSDKKEAEASKVMIETTLADWVRHATEGMMQSAEIEGANYETSRYDHCLWKVHLSHSINCLVTSKLRRCIYASDGQMVTIIRQDTDNRHFRKFDLTDRNPFNQQNVSQLLLVNDMTRELLLACSRNGIVRIWDPSFTAWSDDYAKLPQLVSAGFPLADQMKLSDDTERCLFDWSQSTGRVLCTGLKSVRIWDAHFEKLVRDIPYNSSAAGPSSGKFDRYAMPTALSGDLDEMGNLVSIGYADGNIDVFDMRLPRQRAMRMETAASTTTSAAPSIMSLYLRKKGTQNYLFAANRDGMITKWEPRMYREPSSRVLAPWETGAHTAFTVHEDSRIMASASDSNILIYDVATLKKSPMINPPLLPVDLDTPASRRDSRNNIGAFGFLRTDSQRKMSQQAAALQAQMARDSRLHKAPKITALTMHQMRLMTVAGYDDNTVCVYGSTKPGLTANYENAKY